MKTNTAAPLCYLQDKWDEKVASKLDEPERLRYRSNLLGDLRLTNFGGGNTSSKIIEADPLTGQPVPVLWVKGSGGDLGSIQRGGFATLYLDKLHALEGQYRGVEHEDDMVGMYPLCSFRNNPVAASIDTPLHGFLPFAHVDHLHPDWGIALAAAANGKAKMEQFNREFGHTLIWLPWQRPGFELGLMLKQAVEDNPGCDGIVLGGHGLFSWGETQHECYLHTITLIDHIGQFIGLHLANAKGPKFGGESNPPRKDRTEIAMQLLPWLRGQVSQRQPLLATYCDLPEVLQFVGSRDAERLAFLGTSCPDHFIRTKIRPLYVPWNPEGTLDDLKAAIEGALQSYRTSYAEYYGSFATADSPAMRDSNPTVVLIPGVGMFSFGKNKTESRITGEFYVNAIHVMEGACALEDGAQPEELPQAGKAAPSSAFQVCQNYVALPASEAFRIEYWRLEEAKIRRQPPEKQLSRRILLIVGGGSGIGREVALLAAARGAHVVVADRDLQSAEAVCSEGRALAGKEALISVAVDISKRDKIQSMLKHSVQAFGGLDIVINTAAIFPSLPDGIIPDEQWGQTLDLNVTANYLLADEAAKLFRQQNLPGSVVLTSSANAVVAKRGSEAYDVSKAALSHLVRELAVSLAPLVRVNGICPATVVKGSTMFPRDRVIASLNKYGIAFKSGANDDELRTLLAEFYAGRTLTHQPIDPKDCAEAILFLAGPQARCTTGHLIPVDGGLVEAFLR
jgi:rhamnose utilization protein RhaD (predicted bifunctional aldolase and dehydrogenase)/NAD(P)-dependent dehydrogenase (short-subunit alcohol dehydrogenase family)